MNHKKLLLNMKGSKNASTCFVSVFGYCPAIGRSIAGAGYPLDASAPTSCICNAWRQIPGQLRGLIAPGLSVSLGGGREAGCRDADDTKKDRFPGGPAFFVPLAPWG